MVFPAVDRRPTGAAAAAPQSMTGGLRWQSLDEARFVLIFYLFFFKFYYFYWSWRHLSIAHTFLCVFCFNFLAGFVWFDWTYDSLFIHMILYVTFYTSLIFLLLCNGKWEEKCNRPVVPYPAIWIDYHVHHVIVYIILYVQYVANKQCRIWREKERNARAPKRCCSRWTVELNLVL